MYTRIRLQVVIMCLSLVRHCNLRLLLLNLELISLRGPARFRERPLATSMLELKTKTVGLCMGPGTKVF